MAVLFVLFIVVPIVELVLIIQVGQVLGAWNTVGLLIIDSLVGAWLVKHQGLGLLKRSRERLQKGEMPSDEIFSGIAILFAGALMLTPGFLTDAVGLIILIPPIRSVAIGGIRRNFRSRATNTSATWNLETWNSEEPCNEDGPPFGEQDN
ncbi:MAG: FxsA family protein [Acidimicrobiales bacterium]|nr:FxsA family protein [Acidimicrobiales bacterium]